MCTYHVISNGFSDLWCWRNWVNIQKSRKNCNAFINPNIILSSKDKINNEYGSSITNVGNNSCPISVLLMEWILFLINESVNEGKVCRNWGASILANILFVNNQKVAISYELLMSYSVEKEFSKRNRFWWMLSLNVFLSKEKHLFKNKPILNVKPKTL